MNNKYRVEWVTGLSCRKRISDFLKEMDDTICPVLSKRVDIDSYASKLAKKADTIFIVDHMQDIASCSVYCNMDVAFISSIVVMKKYEHQQIGTMMIKNVLAHVKEKGCSVVELEVKCNNINAFNFYIKNEFLIKSYKSEWMTMKRVL